MAATSAGDSPVQDMLVLSEKLRYAGVREVADSRSLHEMFTSMKTLAARGVSRSVRISLVATSRALITRTKPDEQVLTIVPWRSISTCSRGDKQLLSSMFAFTTVNMVEGLPAGFVCHVYVTESADAAESIVLTLGKICQKLAESSSDRISMYSLGSIDSKDSGLSREASQAGAGTGSLASRRRHRRTRSDGSNKIESGINTNYLLEQTVQNLYRRLRTDPSEVVATHMARDGTHQRLTWVAEDLITWLVAQKDFPSRSNALDFLNTAMSQGHFVVVDSQVSQILDNKFLYRFSLDARRRRSSQSAISSSVELQPNFEESLTGTPPQLLPLEEDEITSSDHPSPQVNLVQLDLEQLKAELDDGTSLFYSLSEIRKARLLGRCLQKNEVERASLFYEHGAEVSSSINQLDDTLLHWAASVNGRQAASFLLSRGADVNASNKQGVTPLHLAAARNENLETAIILIERGAKVRAVNLQGKRPIDDFPDLAEIQRRLCESVGQDIMSNKDDRISRALKTLAKLSQNPETYTILGEELLKSEVQSALKQTCAESRESQELLVEYIHNTMESDEYNDPDLLACVLALGGISEQVQTSVLTSITELTRHCEDDFFGILANLDLAPLVKTVAEQKNGSLVQQALRLIAFVTRYPKARDKIATSSIPQVAKIFLSDKLYATSHPEIVVYVLMLCGNIFAIINLENQFKNLGLPDLIKPFLHHTDPELRYHAARALVILGEKDVGDVNIFTPLLHECYLGVESQLLADHQLEIHQFNLPSIRGSSIENLIFQMTSSEFEIDLTGVFITLDLYWPSLITLRLLLYRFHCVPIVVSGHLQLEHELVFEFLRVWMEECFEALAENDRFLITLSNWLHKIKSRGGAYRKLAEELLHRDLITSKHRPVQTSGVNDYASAPHEQLYRKTLHTVLKGDTKLAPPTLMRLASLQVHIEELSKQPLSFFTLPASEFPAVKLRSIFPNSFLRTRDQKQITTDLQQGYDKVRHMSIRDAKHFYLFTFSQATNQDGEFFEVRELSADNRRSVKVCRTLNITSRSVHYLDAKTNEKLATFSLWHLQRWYRVPLKDRTSGVDRLKSFRGRASKMAALALAFDSGDLLIGADEATVAAISAYLVEVTHGSLKVALRTENVPEPHEQMNDTLDDENDLDLNLFAPADQNTSTICMHTANLVVKPERPSSKLRLSPIASAPGSKATSPSHSPTTSRPSSPEPRNSESPSQQRRRLSTFSGERRIAITRPRFQSHMLVRKGQILCDCPPVPRLTQGLDLNNVQAYLLLKSPTEFARQLTIYEHNLFKRIQAAEVWAKVRTGSSSNPQPTPSVDAMITHFNAISSWTAYQVVSESDRNKRVEVLQLLISAAHRCRELRNFNGVMEIISGLGMTPVRRLSDTWGQISSDALGAFERLEQLMSTEKNFLDYRTALEKTWSPAIPYFGMFLRDLTFLHHGNPDFIALGLLNVRKIRDMSKIFELMADLQEDSYPLLIIPEIATFISKLKPIDEDVLFQHSHDRQPPLIRKVGSASRLSLDLRGSEGSPSRSGKSSWFKK